MADDIQKAIASEFHNGRQPEGNSNASVVNASGAPSASTKARPKGNVTQDVLGTGSKANRGRTAVNASQDGACCTIKAVRPPQVEQAAPTQANGKIVPPSHRSGKNFYSQVV